MGVMDIHTSMDKVIIFGILFVKESNTVQIRRTWIFKRNCEIEYSINWGVTTLCGGMVLQEYLSSKLWWKRNGTL